MGKSPPTGPIPCRSSGVCPPPSRAPALYLSLSFKIAFREVSAGFAHRLTPYVLCSYDVDCEDIADLRTDAGRAEHDVALEDLACSGGDAFIAGREPASWGVVRCLLADG